ncbi:MAG: peptide deformylase [Ignavibacteriaceae bacterium]
MALLPITLIGDKILKRKASLAKDVDPKIIELIHDMFETMRNARGIGLAANQVGADKSIFITDVSVVEGHEDEKPLVFINPVITERSEEVISMEEGCLSIPDIRAEIERPEKVIISYKDTDFKEQTLKAEGLLARVIQHEYDHLQGTLFTDLISSDIKKKLNKDIIKIKKRKIEIQYPVSEDIDYQLVSSSK